MKFIVLLLKNDACANKEFLTWNPTALPTIWWKIASWLKQHDSDTKMPNIQMSFVFKKYQQKLWMLSLV